jgi:hypothetical protein
MNFSLMETPRSRHCDSQSEPAANGDARFAFMFVTTALASPQFNTPPDCGISISRRISGVWASLQIFPRSAPF